MLHWAGGDGTNSYTFSKLHNIEEKDQTRELARIDGAYLRNGFNH
jgi:hypothetical protein